MKNQKFAVAISTIFYLQIFLVIVGLASQVGILYLVITNKLATISLISSISVILSFLGIGVYTVYGYRHSKVYYHIAVAFFLLAILINVILPFRDMTQKILLTLLFGLFSAFIFTSDMRIASRYLTIIAVIISLTFFIYSSIYADVNNLGPVDHPFFASAMMYISIFTPVIMSGLFAFISFLHSEQKK